MCVRARECVSVQPTAGPALDAVCSKSQKPKDSSESGRVRSDMRVGEGGTPSVLGVGAGPAEEFS